MTKLLTTQKVLTLVLGALLLFFMAGATSCSEDSASINSTNCLAIFDYETPQSLPRSRFALFLGIGSDIHRAQSLKVRCDANGYEWTVSSPTLITKQDLSWAGYAFLSYPQDALMTQGFYIASYIDAQEKSVEAGFSLTYPDDIPKTKACDLESYIKDTCKNDYIKKYAVFNEEGSLIYMGLSTSQSPTWMFESFSDADSYRECLFVSFTSALCILPAHYRSDQEEAKAIENTGEGASESKGAS